MAGACLPAGDLPRVAEGLVALYRFDDMSGTTIADSSGNGHHLTIGEPAGVTWGVGTLLIEGVAAIASGEVMPVSEPSRRVPVGDLRTCKPRLISGRVVIEVEDALTGADRAKGLMLACQARAAQELVVDA